MSRICIIFSPIINLFLPLPRSSHTLKADLVISGESYGGLYTPNLAYHVMQHNKVRKKETGETAPDDSVDSVDYGMPLSLIDICL